MSLTFSVVIPTYNRAEILSAALKSVLDQTYRDFEVIIIDNDSTDNTLDMLHRIQKTDSRVQVLSFRDNHVIGAVRNAGIRASRGTYIAFLDSDDTWNPNKLERVAETIAENPEVGLLCHDEEMVRDGSAMIRSSCGPPKSYRGNIHDYLLLRGNCVSMSATVVARRYLDEVGHFSEDPKINTVEDYDLWLRMSKVCEFNFTWEVLGMHLYHPEGFGSANIEVQLQGLMVVLEKYFKQHAGAHRLGLRTAIRRRYAEAFYGAGRQYQRRENLKKPLAYYSQALMQYPFYLRTYGGLTLLLVDILLGQGRRKRIVKSLRLGSWPMSWMAP